MSTNRTSLMNSRTFNNTYISLFSGAGIGCYGFKKNKFRCIATNEILEKRLNIQKINKKCKYKTGYILGDINDLTVYQKILDELDFWKKNENVDNVDVLIATPPCQGMSVANQKKTKRDNKRNSLVVKAIEIIEEINPKIFIIENVKSFLKTLCYDKEDKMILIQDKINNHLSKNYLINSQVLNFKNYGSNSSRLRTLVVGVRKDYLDIITPFEIFPNFTKEKTLKQIIGKFESLKNMNDFSAKNLLHHFKPYSPYMRDWITNLKENESAMDNEDLSKKPHRIINGEVIYNKAIFGDKFKRQSWNKVAPCIHTVSDCLASQNTIHPTDDRTFSIAELMKMMAIPKSFKWTNLNFKKMNDQEKLEWLAKNQRNIRESIGEAVPTGVFYRIAKNINDIIKFNGYDFFTKSTTFENNNTKQKQLGAFYTSKINLAYLYDQLPDFKNKEIRILEPAVGTGNFLLPIFKKYENYKKVNITVVDVDLEALKELESKIKKIKLKNIFNIEYLHQDFIDYKFTKDFDLIVGNPPFLKLDKKIASQTTCKNIFELFWKKAVGLSKHIIFISPKYLISSPSYEEFRHFIQNQNIIRIVDFGELGFKNVKIETISIQLNNNKKTQDIEIISIFKNLKINQKKTYIFDPNIPYWILYRNQQFDDTYNSLKKDIFNIYKSYEVKKKLEKFDSSKNLIKVIRSKNIDIHSPKLIDKDNYDRYIEKEIFEKTKIYKLIKTKQNNNKQLFLIPNLSYYPRVIRFPDGHAINGSVIVAELKDKNIELTNKDIKFFYTKRFREFYSLALNYSTRTLNVDKYTINFYGILANKYEN